MSGDRHDHDDDQESSLFFPTGNSSDVNSKILFIAIVTLSAVVVIVAMLHVYVRYVLRRQASRRAAGGVGLTARIHTDETPKRGLEPSVIASLPVLKYGENENPNPNPSGHGHGHGHGHEPDHPGLINPINPECSVCLSSFKNGQMIRVLPNCNHHFHAECIDKWLESHSTCPVCRHEVEVGSTISPLPREPSTRLGDEVGPPSAPPLEPASSVGVTVEGTSDGIKGNGTTSRLSSFRRMISMDRSSRRNNSCIPQDGIDDLERQ